jgi:hypothetical protein
MGKKRELENIRVDLKKIKNKYKNAQDAPSRNLMIVIDLFILCTYFPDAIDSVYYTLDGFLEELTGGKN